MITTTQHLDFDFVDTEQVCAYLPNQLETIHYKVAYKMTKQELSCYLNKGWRRFGALLHRPMCKSCNACQSLRVDVPKFSFSKSVRRVLKKNNDLDIIMQPPTITDEHIELFNSYHLSMEKKRGWEYKAMDKEGYYKSFLSGMIDSTYEVLYRLHNKLIAIDIVDILDNGISTTYFIYDHQFADRSLGNLSIYNSILIARQKGLAFLYLGYFIAGCDTLNYKAKYKPYELLKSTVGKQDEVIWVKSL